MINKHTATRTLSSGNTAKVTVERGTWGEDKYWDGIPVGIETHAVDRMKISLIDKSGEVLASGDRVIPMEDCKILSFNQYQDAKDAGMVGKVGQAWIGSNAAEAIKSAMAEAMTNAPKAPQQIEMEAKESERKAKRIAWEKSPEGIKSRKEQEANERFDYEMNRWDSDF